jgi:hypothetical protein
MLLLPTCRPVSSACTNIIGTPTKKSNYIFRQCESRRYAGRRRVVRNFAGSPFLDRRIEPPAPHAVRGNEFEKLGTERQRQDAPFTHKRCQDRSIPIFYFSISRVSEVSPRKNPPAGSAKSAQTAFGMPICRSADRGGADRRFAPIRDFRRNVTHMPVLICPPLLVPV